MGRRFNIIAAACDNMGIGIKGDIPWRLKKEMAYFTNKTSSTKYNDKKNAVIMGRKTWESIPLKYKPLSNRFNIVISNTISETGYSGVPVFKNLTQALEYLTPLSDIETVWIIGGSGLYEEAIHSPLCDKVYLTRVKGNFDCDTFFPKVPSFYEEIKEDGVPEGIQIENNISYVFTVLKNTQNSNNSSS